jgi:hypothetical protein
MKFAKPLTQELSIINNGVTYKKIVYQPPTSISGVVDEDYPDYDSSATYNTGDYVIVPELKTIYRCTSDNTTEVFPPSDPSKWVDYGFVNSYKMLSTDEQIGTQTIGDGIKMTLPFSRCDTLGLINVKFATLLLEQMDNSDHIVTDEDVGTGDGSTKEFSLDNDKVVYLSESIYVDSTLNTRDSDYNIDYDNGVITFTNAPADGAKITADYEKAVIVRHIDGRDIGCTSFAGYFYDEVREKTRVITTDLEWLPDSTLKLTFVSESGGNTKIGSIVIGGLQALGVTLMGTELKFEDRSKIMNDDFTNTRKVIRYGHVRVLNGQVLFDTGDFDRTAQKISDIIGKNVLFVPDESDRFSEMTNIAYIEDFSMPLENPVVFKTTITLIGVA